MGWLLRSSMQNQGFSRASSCQRYVNRAVREKYRRRPLLEQVNPIFSRAMYRQPQARMGGPTPGPDIVRPRCSNLAQPDGCGLRGIMAFDTSMPILLVDGYNTMVRLI